MRYPIPRKGRFETVVKKSRFICSIRRTDSIEDAKATIAEISAEFADASHNCWAYKIGAPDDTSRLGCGDDGEPKGTAGRPMLTIVRHAELGDVTVVVTRYFGGTKLGTGGLVKAYGDSVKDALTRVRKSERVAKTSYRITAPYASVDTLKRGFLEHEARILDETYAAAVNFEVTVPDDLGTSFRSWLSGIPDAELQP